MLKQKDMSLKSILHDVGAWFAKAFKTVRDDADTVAITITQNIKLALDTGLVKVITDLIPGTLDDKILAFLQTAIPKALAVELALKGIPDNPTPEQIQEFILLVEQTISSKKDWQEQSAFWTKLAVNIYNQIETDLNKNPDQPNLSFADMVAIVDSAYDQYVEHKAAQDQANTGDLTDTNPDKTA